MKLLAAVVLALLILASPATAQTLTPQDARATLTMARAEVARAATQVAVASEMATANAPTATMLPAMRNTARRSLRKSGNNERFSEIEAGRRLVKDCAGG